MSTQPTDDKLVDFLVTAAHDYASQILVGTTKPLMPTICLVQRAKRWEANPAPVKVIGCPWRDDKEKKAMVMKVGKQIALEGAWAWSFLSEAWTAVATPEEIKAGQSIVRPGDRPAGERKETVFCMIGLGSDKPLKLWSWDIKREAGEQSKCVGLGSGVSGQAGLESWIGALLNAAIDFHAFVEARAQEGGR